MIVVYGLRNCDSCRRARASLDELNIEYCFVDYRNEPLDGGTLSKWVGCLGWENILNRRSSTWRQLQGTRKLGLNNTSAKALMLEFPTLIKRPIIQTNGELLVGFNEEQKEKLNGSRTGVDGKLAL